MKKKIPPVRDYAELERQAEERLRELQKDNPELFKSYGNIHQMLHELAVHRVELEMQQEELIESRKALEESLGRYTELYDFAPVGYLTLSRDGVILEANLTATKIIGVERSSLIGKRFARCIVYEDLPQFNAMTDLVFGKEVPGFCEVRICEGIYGESPSLVAGLKASGVVVRCTLRIDAVASEDGKKNRITLTDISEQKRVEQENANLQATMDQMRRMETVGQLAGGIAHQFNNTLQVMLGNIDLLIENGEFSSDITERLDVLRWSVLKSAKLTRQLLAFAQRQPFKPKVIDLRTTVADMLGKLRCQLGKHIELLYFPDRELTLVNIDPVQVGQILEHLAANARDAISDKGTVTVSIRNVVLDAAFCHGVADAVPGEYVMLSVIDDGCGMDEKTIEHIFEPFFTSRSMAERAGLGLATVYGIVRQNDGFILVRSGLGTGSEFDIYLHRCSGEEVNGSHDELVGSPGGKETLLLVEDDREGRILISRFLESCGYVVLQAENPDEALRIFNDYFDRIRLLITDMILPGVSGRELALKMTTRCPGLKCLFISGYTPDYFVSKGVLDMNMPFLGKPFSRSRLLFKVREVLDTPQHPQ